MKVDKYEKKKKKGFRRGFFCFSIVLFFHDYESEVNKIIIVVNIPVCPSICVIKFSSGASAAYFVK